MALLQPNKNCSMFLKNFVYFCIFTQYNGFEKIVLLFLYFCFHAKKLWHLPTAFFYTDMPVKTDVTFFLGFKAVKLFLTNEISC